MRDPAEADRSERAKLHPLRGEGGTPVHAIPPVTGWSPKIHLGALHYRSDRRRSIESPDDGATWAHLERGQPGDAMHARAIVPILLPLTTLLFQGCDRGTIPTESSTRKAVVALAVGTHFPDRHVVVFASAQVPGAFEEEVAAFGGVVERVVPAGGLAVVSSLGEDALGALRADTDVLSVEPDATLEPAVELAFGDETYERSEVGIESHGGPTGAAFFSRQWNLRAIGADVAWAQGHLGSPDVLVGILDSGIDYLHPELAGRVDLSRSISLVPALDAQVASLFPGRHPVTDLNSHGTAMAGLIVSNAHLLAGGSQRTTVFGVKVHDGIDGEIGRAACRER